MTARRVQVVLGLGFGDEGKGATVDYLARQTASAPVIVRWNGGAQAMHHVVCADGRRHCFAQLGAGMFVDGARTHLGPGMVVDPYALAREAEAIAAVGVRDALARVTIDPRAWVVTPWHAIVNQVRELARGDGAHGTTGRGIGEAALGRWRLRVAELGDAEKVREVREGLIAEAAAIAAGMVDVAMVEVRPAAVAVDAGTTAGRVEAGAADGGARMAGRAARLVTRAAGEDLRAAFADGCRVIAGGGAAGRGGATDAARVTTEVPDGELIFEGAQGALLDRDHGFAPHVTPSRITRAAAVEALAMMGIEAAAVEVWGVLRAVHTRHGAGPLPSEDAALRAALPEPDNDDVGWAGRFRVGWFDAVLARYALGFAGPIDRLAITWVDAVERLAGRSVVTAWEVDGRRVEDLVGVEAGERTVIARAARPVLAPIGDVVEGIERVIGRRVALIGRGATAAERELVAAEGG